jgi:hypothetical protein
VLRARGEGDTGGEEDINGRGEKGRGYGFFALFRMTAPTSNVMDLTFIIIGCYNYFTKKIV